MIILNSGIQLYFNYQINNIIKHASKHDMPETLNSLAMLEKLRDMNFNLLEYILGDEEKEQEYFDNLEEFHHFRALIPNNNDKAQEKIEKSIRTVEYFHEEVAKHLFKDFHPDDKKQVDREINSMSGDIVWPLERLLNEMKDEDFSVVGENKKNKDIIHDDLPKTRLYLKLVDEAEDMLSDLGRYETGDLSARQAFYNDALQFEIFLAELKPINQKPKEIIRINEIERLYKELKAGGEHVFGYYDAQDKIRALQIIEKLEQNEIKEAEMLLEDFSEQAQRKVNDSMMNLNRLSNLIFIIILVLASLTIVLLYLIIFYIHKTIFIPLENVSTAVDRLRQGKKNVQLSMINHNDELTDVFFSLLQFQSELSELDDLRRREQHRQEEHLLERNMATRSLEQLKMTQSNIIANEKRVSLGTLVAGISHEINTPIGASVTISSTLSTKIKDFLKAIKTGKLKSSSLAKFEQESVESLTILENSLEHASNLIQSFKQVAVDQASSHRREFNLSKKLNEIKVTLQHRIKGTNVKLNIEGADDIVIDSYPGDLGQVITNLFNNALLHGFNGQNDGDIVIRFHQKGNSVKLLFSDNGKGINEENLNKVFDLFYTTRLGEGGSGLGLYIVHNIITGLMGGDISVESQIGVTFQMILPLVAPMAKETLDE
ncbi:MAG: HAMP domain-containing histidine kinase [Methylococcales bacterium]|nr:HAMP domain-containing histidine kinase [Methylococcales bacterium]